MWRRLEGVMTRRIKENRQEKDVLQVCGCVGVWVCFRLYIYIHTYAHTYTGVHGCDLQERDEAASVRGDRANDLPPLCRPAHLLRHLHVDRSLYPTEQRHALVAADMLY